MLEIYQKCKLKKHTIPKFDEFYTELKKLFSAFTKKRKNIILIIDDQSFETDSEIFDKEIGTWMNRLCEHIYIVIDEIPDFTNKIKMLKKCENLNLKGLELDHVYISLYQNIITCKYNFISYYSELFRYFLKTENNIKLNNIRMSIL